MEGLASGVSRCFFFSSPYPVPNITQIRDNHILTPKTGYMPLYATYGSQRTIYGHDSNVATTMCDVFPKIGWVFRDGITPSTATPAPRI